jgi:hypothetical protein
VGRHGDLSHAQTVLGRPAVLEYPHPYPCEIDSLTAVGARDHDIRRVLTPTMRATHVPSLRRRPALLPRWSQRPPPTGTSPIWLRCSPKPSLTIGRARRCAAAGLRVQRPGRTGGLRHPLPPRRRGRPPTSGPGDDRRHRRSALRPHRSMWSTRSRCHRQCDPDRHDAHQNATSGRSQARKRTRK